MRSTTISCARPAISWTSARWTASHVNYWEARGFCLGYFTGGIDLHDALAVGTDFPQLACPGEGVTRNDVVEAFVTYAQAHPEHLQERPMDTVFRAVADRWPCA